MSVIFLLLNYQHDKSVGMMVLQAENSRNTLLINTFMPIIETNLAFGLIESNREYLNQICKDNSNIAKITLVNTLGEELYHYESIQTSVDAKGNDTITKQLMDKETGSVLGTLQVQFSRFYVEKILREHQYFSMQIFAMFLLIIVVVVALLQRAFRPMGYLLRQINAFEPDRDNFQLERTDKSDEIGVIQNAIVDMIDRIELHTRELRELNQTLEEKILSRTLALNAKRIALEEEIKKVKEQEEMLISQSRLAAMGEMMSMIAHQWRQPLATSSLMITNYKIKTMLETKTNELRDDVLDSISDTLLYLSETIDDFQTYFKPDNHKDTFELHTLLERTYNFSKARLHNYDVSLHIDCVKGLVVETYFNELVQVVLNIINNAIDAIVESKTLRKDVFITCKQQEGSTIIEIRDTGGGIAPEVLGHLFEPYFSTKGKNGTGLGLYMARMIVEKHIEGALKVENTDVGACFSVVLAKQYEENL
jgi:C4-dicarboxylate-specific signal transduction histidine kinase